MQGQIKDTSLKVMGTMHMILYWSIPDSGHRSVNLSHAASTAPEVESNLYSLVAHSPPLHNGCMHNYPLCRRSTISNFVYLCSVKLINRCQVVRTLLLLLHR